MSFLRINRFGVVKASKSSHNQCKDVGHRDYKYHIAIVTCSSNTDYQGFIIDHKELHAIIEKVFKSKMSSCEDMSKHVAKAIEKEAINQDIHCVDLYVKIQPVLAEATDNYAFMEYSKSGKFI